MASWLGGELQGTRLLLSNVSKAVRHCPIIDNHAHPLLKPEALGRRPLMSLTTEASGDAIDAASTSLAHRRAVKQLAGVLRCFPKWESVVAAIEQRRIDCPDDWTAECLAGIETILLDDGLDDENEIQDVSWHSSFTRSECKRIVRIEHLAEGIIERQLEESGHGEPGFSTEILLNRVVQDFQEAIDLAVGDADVVAFKSIICYRTGLAISGYPNEAGARHCLDDIVETYRSTGKFRRLQHQVLNDLLVHRVALTIRESGNQKKPLQFHTGLGDSDIVLTTSSPAHLQKFIAAYPTVPIVLLHASYPWTRELGYLATVYPNVYADLSEVFPIVSRRGQEAILHEILEICPWSKILWGTDGHWFPETYLLAVKQIRDVMESVLCDYVRTGQLGHGAAIELARSILFGNANKLYNLQLTFTELKKEDTEAETEESRIQTDFEIYESFVRATGAHPDFIRICWNDYTASPRMRMVPFRKFMGLLQEGKSSDIGITKACFSLIQQDWLVPGTSPTGEFRLHPDFSSLKTGPVSGHVSMYGEFREEDGSRVALCPRSLLQRAVESAVSCGLAYLLGFEIEFLLLERLEKPEGNSRYVALNTDGHAWSTSRYFASPQIEDLLRHMVEALAKAGIHAEQVHAESAPGQFEISLPPLPPVEAVDALLHAREILSVAATSAGFRMTLHPKPFAGACGTASHVHMSITSQTGSKPELYESFYAGILKHLRGILAFTYSSPASYERMVDGCWAGGRWVAWGTQNRETALRKIRDSHWEFKALDGLANPYLALGAILLAGTHGVSSKEPLTWRDCEVDPASLTENDKKELGVSEMLPASMEEALKALREDETLVGLVGQELVDRYIACKETELNMLGSMGDEERRQWLMARY